MKVAYTVFYKLNKIKADLDNVSSVLIETETNHPLYGKLVQEYNRLIDIKTNLVEIYPGLESLN